MKEYKAVIFDLDGTLFDTSFGIIKSIEYTVEKLYLRKLTEEEKLSFIGPPPKHSFKKIYSLSEEEINKAVNIFREEYKNKYLFDAVLYPNIKDLLEILKSKNILMAIATNKREDLSVLLIEHFRLSEYFSVIKGSDFENTLTKTDMINFCIDKLKVAGENSIMIGDSVSDEEGAKKAKLDFIAVTYGFGYKNKKELDIGQTVSVCSSVQKVIDFFKKQN